MYEEEEEEQVERVKIPKYKILYMDLDLHKKEETINTGERLATNEDKKPEEAKNDILEKILEYATLSLEDCQFDKDIATKLKRKLDEDKELNNNSVSNPEKNVEEHGVWQVIVGRQFVASVTFDARYLVYFLFEEISKYFLVFRS